MESAEIQIEIKNTDTDNSPKSEVKLDTLPFVKTSEVISGTPPQLQTRTENVDPQYIIGAPNLNHWGHEYHKGWGNDTASTVEMFSQAIQNQPAEFWANNQHPVKLDRVDGPAGPIYVVEDGSHRVAAAKLAQADAVPCEVIDYSNTLEFRAVPSEITLIDWWESLLRIGIINGSIQTTESYIKLTLSEPPPIHWIMQGPNKFAKVNRAYKKIYGDEAFNNSTLPPDLQAAMFDPGATMVWVNKKLYSKNTV